MDATYLKQKKKKKKKDGINLTNSENMLFIYVSETILYKTSSKFNLKLNSIFLLECMAQI